jgi:hypothetical protein
MVSNTPYSRIKWFITEFFGKVIVVMKAHIKLALAENWSEKNCWVKLLTGVEITAAVAQLVGFASPRCTNQEVCGSKSPLWWAPCLLC